MSLLIFHLCTDPIVYAAYIFTAVCGFGFAYFIQQFERRLRLDYLRTVMAGVALYFGFGTPYNAQNNAHRVYYTFALFASIIYVTLVNTMVIQLFTSPIYGRQVETIDAILGKNFNLVGSEFELQKLMQQNEVKLAWNSISQLNWSKIIFNLNLDLFGGLAGKI